MIMRDEAISKVIKIASLLLVARNDKLSNEG